MATEWATSVSKTVSIPPASADDRFNAALDALTAKIDTQREDYGLDELDLIQAIRDARAQAMHTGLHGPTVDKVLLHVLLNYKDQIEGEWA